MESIREMFLKIKEVFMYPPADVLIVFIMILVGSAGFGLGRLSALQEPEETPVSIIEEERQSASTIDAVSDATGSVVASKNGTKYHFPWCPGAQQISEQNKVTFTSIEEARANGYTPATNCKGLE